MNSANLLTSSFEIMWGTALSRGNFQSENEKKTVTEIENASHIPYRRQIHAAIAVMNVFILIVVLLICVFQQSSVGFQNSFFGKGHLLSHRPSVLCNRESPPLYLSTIELEDFVNTIGIYIDSPIGGYAKDMMTAACLGTMSDVFAQIISQKGNDSNSVTASPPNDRAPTSREFKSGGLFPAFNSIRIDIKRTIRFAIFGFIDGAVGHTWFYTLETYVRTTRITDVFLRILIDAGVSTASLLFIHHLSCHKFFSSTTAVYSYLVCLVPHCNDHFGKGPNWRYR